MGRNFKYGERTIRLSVSIPASLYRDLCTDEHSVAEEIVRRLKSSEVWFQKVELNKRATAYRPRTEYPS